MAVDWDHIRERCVRSRTAQGLPPTITEPAALDAFATHFATWLQTQDARREATKNPEAA